MVSGMDIYREVAKAQSWGMGGDLGDGWVEPSPTFSHSMDIFLALILGWPTWCWR